MITKTKAICLHTYKYSETSIIAKIFTEKIGICSYIVKGIRSKKSKNKMAAFQPLSLLDLEVSHHPKRDLQFIKDIKIEVPTIQIINSIEKRFVSVFISEVLLKVLIKDDPQPTLFNFIWWKIISLEKAKKTNENYPLIFLIELSKHLGFHPSNDNNNFPYFNLKTGEFSKIYQDHTIQGSLKNHLTLLLKNKEITLSKKDRSVLLNTLIGYYRLHQYNLNNVRSHEIIQLLN